MSLPPLPLEEWQDTKLALHLYLQIIGKIRLSLMPPRNHWWHVPLYLTSQGVTTRPIPWKNGAFEIWLDFSAHRAAITTTEGGRERFQLAGQTVAAFHSDLFGALEAVGVHTEIWDQPFDLPVDTPFSEDDTHRPWDPDQVERFWKILVWAYGVFSRFSGRFVGKTSPVHLFWHSFDLAVTRFSGREAPPMDGAGIVASEAYSHECISFGFWAGDDNVPEPAFYSYTWPEPEGLTDTGLEPDGALWNTTDRGSTALYTYEMARTSGDPDAAVLSFLESAYQNGARLAGWDVDKLSHPRWAG